MFPGLALLNKHFLITFGTTIPCFITTLLLKFTHNFESPLASDQRFTLFITRSDGDLWLFVSGSSATSITCAASKTMQYRSLIELFYCNAMVIPEVYAISHNFSMERSKLIYKFYLHDTTSTSVHCSGNHSSHLFVLRRTTGDCKQASLTHCFGYARTQQRIAQFKYEHNDANVISLKSKIQHLKSSSSYSSLKIS
ncbi:hypothetical protein GQ44DRAFT_343660 [Phaeosphaeriaceae sp. PMI808]|nr:hypothetical protein GQ44DRAFT_343660 [Phaeosphaeriaceae sp. PMI808]